jgi:hypothetical protein
MLSPDLAIFLKIQLKQEQHLNICKLNKVEKIKTFSEKILL